MPTVLLFTCSEYGQANVNLAISYELALAGVDVHIASFPFLESRVSSLRELITHHALRLGAKPTGSVVFHECKGFPSYLDALEKRGVRLTNLRHSPGLLGALESYSKLVTLAPPWSPTEYLAGIENCKDIITTVKPDIVVIDKPFYVAWDACNLLKQRFILVLPNSIKEIATIVQPYLAFLWKYPACVVMSSGFPYPLKWWHIPLNIYLHFRLVLCFMTAVNVRQIQALRSSLGLPSRVGHPLHRGVTYICPALVETDFHFAVIPDELCLCGPIVLPFDPLEESAPELKKWLDNGPTVLVNLGPHVESDEEFAREMAGAFRILLEHHDQRGSGGMQVLWKVQAKGDIQEAIDETIGNEIKEGRVRVLAWLVAEPISILQHANVVCTVHHGGANSFYEGVWSGVPQIVLPVWYDTFDYARRVELLNVGIFGNKACAPSVKVGEFSKALLRATGDGQEAVSFRAAAQRLKEVCRGKWNGRQRACTAILKEIGIGN